MKRISHRRIRNAGVTLLSAISAFLVYSCMYAFRKPFTSASFDGHDLLGLHFKIWLVISQTLGYTLSKFIGISLVGSLKKENRGKNILLLIGIAWISLFFFALFPPPYNMIFLLINGLPLGMIYGLVFSYLEGRKSTEFLGAVLAASFIFASGFSQSVGKFILVYWSVNEWWMPWVTGLVFFPLLIVSVWVLDRTPEPDRHDIFQRTKRVPMTKIERSRFIKNFFPGLFLLITAYVLLTIIRDYRSNFAADMWKEMGHSTDSSVFAWTELPASVIVLLIMSMLGLIRNNIQALMVNHLVIIAGLFFSMISTLLYQESMINPFIWMTCTGVGLYIAYVPFNCMLFERLIASFKYVSNAVFIIYVADSFGYLGSDLILVAKNFFRPALSWQEFFSILVIYFSVAGIVLVLISSFYFHKKYVLKYPRTTSILTYG